MDVVFSVCIVRRGAIGARVWEVYGYAVWEVLHLIDICYLPCICLWQVSQIQTCLCVVVEPGFVTTLPVYEE